MAGTEFRIDADGPGLIALSPLYAAGEDHRRGYAGGVFEKSYLGPVLGVVESGTFKYRSPTGEAIVAPGSILFGNSGESFCCEHLDDRGNSRAVVAIADDLMSEAAAEAGRAQPRFASAVFPPGPGSLAMQAAIRRLARSGHPMEELLLGLLIEAFGVERGPGVRSSDREARRILDVVRFMVSRYAEAHQLGDLAAAAGVSRFHFLRQFRKLVGTSPNQFLIALRLRAVAQRLEESAVSITEIALDAGFNDISHFNHLFRRAFAMSPGRWRRLGR